ncbi:putative outer membrane protein [Fulvivirga imtechensis AK7]|uniref:Putative outer membrane protein n=1 Tax=Fulvivirga imtechensis AK7 TaxID=1237149 RepID=L8JMR8_9BACT|nr:RagB/SusD family nutrient uptake outer membrane protein [Fulvivirga imtechensis]ELR68774.1 putative outer membrane protein [Fulvivirga imtechensis AK7]
MKTLKNILAVVAIIGLLIGCNEELDLRPPQDVDADLALSSDANVKTTLLGAYDALSEGDLLGGSLQRNAELLGQKSHIQFSGTYNAPAEIWRKDITTVNLDVTEVWLGGYDVINIVNNVISALEVVDEDDRDRISGEAHFIRGLVHFELVKFFAQPYSAGNVASNLGVPLILEPTRGISEENYVARASVADVYDQVIRDLQIAEANLPSDNDVYANKAAAAAVLSRVYLQQLAYEEARDAANRAIGHTNGLFSLASGYAALYNNSSNSSEDIFAIQVNTQDGVNNLQLYFAAAGFGGRGDIEIQPGQLALYDPGDLRLNLYYDDPATGETRTGKYINQFANVPFIRLSELYLTRAEGNIRLGETVGDTPENDLFQIQERAGLPFNATPTVDDVLLERRRELAHEGHAIHDYKRLQLPVDGLPFDANELVFPIPQREMNVNKNLKQNAGYGG